MAFLRKTQEAPLAPQPALASGEQRPQLPCHAGGCESRHIEGHTHFHCAVCKSPTYFSDAGYDRGAQWCTKSDCSMEYYNWIKLNKGIISPFYTLQGAPFG